MAKGLKVEPISGEHGLRLHVQSRSNPSTPHLVDLSAHGGYGQCTCDAWKFNVWPVVRDETAPKRTKESTCSHIRAALNWFYNYAIETQIKQFGQ